MTSCSNSCSAAGLSSEFDRRPDRDGWNGAGDVFRAATSVMLADSRRVDGGAFGARSRYRSEGRGAHLMDAPVIIEAVDINAILKTLPHRYPMLLIDRVINIRSDYSGIGIKNVTINEPPFQGHFPERPVYPGVMMIEAMAQTAGVIGILSIEGTAEAARGLFSDHRQMQIPQAGLAGRYHRVSPAHHRPAQGDVVVSWRRQGQRRDRRGSRRWRDAHRLNGAGSMTHGAMLAMAGASRVRARRAQSFRGSLSSRQIRPFRRR